MSPKVSICISAFNKPDLLSNTLSSIYRQYPPFQFETIVVDDGSADNRIADVCSRFQEVVYHRIEREPVFRNPCVARNTAYRMSHGEILICQSDEVLHVTDNAIELLINELKPGTFVLANVFCLNKAGKICGEFTGPGRKAPYFFLGALYKEDLYAVGGNDEEFAICPAYEDAWFGDCLVNGRKLTPVYTTKVVGHHQWHEYVSKPENESPSRDLYYKKTTLAKRGLIQWISTGGPWNYIPITVEESSEPIEQTFTKIYQDNYWGSEESRSGAGSTLDSTRLVRQGLEQIIAKYGIRSVLDIPCGDFNWMQHTDLSSIKYIGADIVAELAIRNQGQYGSNTRQFQHLDVTTSDLPYVDLVFCRDCLGHFSERDVKRALKNISRSGATYLLTTTFPKHLHNKLIRTGQWTAINLQAAPYNLPSPVELINEDCQELYPHFNDKSLGLWKLQDIEQFKSITVCVDYDDFLSITLPRNMKHFSQTLVVTAPHDARTQQLCKTLGVKCHVTEVFYENGAAFNKGAAMEEGFDILGRKGWICIWDADIVMPSSIRQPLDPLGLHTPARRLLKDPSEFNDSLDWSKLPTPTQPHEFDGYFQLFNADAVKTPWYSIDWSHAGGCDSDFQFKFQNDHKHRSPFDVLHLGDEGTPGITERVGRNWRGRSLPRIDTGEIPANAEAKMTSVKKMVEDRRRHGTELERISPPTLHSHKKLSKRMCFFWTGSMSWLRYMTLASFRHYNPAWKIELYHPDNIVGNKAWKSHEQDDTQNYFGKDYSDQLDSLDISELSWTSPIKDCSPAQASDLFQWWLLGNNNCFYADMDILWTSSLDRLWNEFCNVDALFCLERKALAIGFFASNCFEFFRQLSNASLRTSLRSGNYQGYGTKFVQEVLERQSGYECVRKLQKCFGKSTIRVAPDQTVYPFDWTKISKIYEPPTKPLPPNTCGIHWFGGDPMSQRWNGLLTPDSWFKYDNYLTRELSRILERPLELDESVNLHCNV